MLNVCFFGDGESSHFKPSHAELNSIDRHNFVCLVPDVIDVFFKTKDSARYRSLEFRIASEDDN